MRSSQVFLAAVCLVGFGLAAYLPREDEFATEQRYDQEEYVPSRPRHSKKDEDEKDYYDPPHYTYEYKVDDYRNGDFKRHRESRREGAVEGYYSLLEADGSLRTVHYTADDKNGFNAVVTRTEPKHEPQNSDHHQP